MSKFKNGNRPTNAKRSTKLLRSICERTVNGDTLQEILDDVGFSRTQFYHWLSHDSAAAHMYACAKEHQGDHAFDKAWIEAKKATPENAHAVRIRVDVLKWRAAKLKPRVYGDRPPDVNVTTNNNVLVLTEERTRELQARLKALRAESNDK